VKLYHEILDDPKVGRLGDRLAWRMVQCFLLAGEANARGQLPPIEDMAWRFRMQAETLESDLIELQKVGIVGHSDGRWFVVNFEERQAPMSGAERMQRKRAAERHEEYRKHGPGHLALDHEAPPTDTDQLPIGDAAVTNRHTDIDTDIDTEADTEADQQQSAAAVVTVLLKLGYKGEPVPRVARWAVQGFAAGHINNPVGWARRAIDDDYPEPDWYLPTAEEQRSRIHEQLEGRLG
jgi:hypothetical protein